MERRQIPKKNYIIMLIITVGVVFLTFYLASWYRTVKEYYRNNSVMIDVVSSIDSESFSSYLLDNPNFILYLSSSSDEKVKKFEKQFKKYIINNEIEEEIIYLDVHDMEKDYINKLLLSYVDSSLKNFKNVVTPNLLYFEDGVIKDALYIQNPNIKKIDMINFLERNNVINND